eukprot:2861639-Pyramimonas_sp.AAC.1
MLFRQQEPEWQAGYPEHRQRYCELMSKSLMGLSALLIAMQPGSPGPTGSPGAPGTPQRGGVTLALTGREGFPASEEVQPGLHAAIKPLLSRSTTEKFDPPPRYLPRY